MTCLDRFFILKTTSSEVNRVTIFKSRYTKFIPDLFFLLCFAVLFLFAQAFDKVLMCMIILYGEPFTIGFISAPFLIAPLIFSFWLEESAEKMRSNCATKGWIALLTALTGCGPLLIVWKVWGNIFDYQTGLNIPIKCHSIPIFHISKNEMSFIRMYYLFNAVLKCIPQIYIVFALMLGEYLTDTLDILAQMSIFLNLVMFSLTMAMTFPLRARPRVFTDSLWVLLNAFCKFMTTLCAWGLNLLIIGFLYANIGYYAFAVHFFRLIFCVWPSWHILRTQPNRLGKFHFTLYLFFLTFIFNIIYIHPFEGKGKLVYFTYYVFKVFTEIFCIYVFTTTPTDAIFVYLTMKCVMVGFLCCYGLVNILHKYNHDKSGCEVQLEIQKQGKKTDEEKEEDNEEEPKSEGPKEERSKTETKTQETQTVWEEKPTMSPKSEKTIRNVRIDVPKSSPSAPKSAPKTPPRTPPRPPTRTPSKTTTRQGK